MNYFVYYKTYNKNGKQNGDGNGFLQLLQPISSGESLAVAESIVARNRKIPSDRSVMITNFILIEDGE